MPTEQPQDLMRFGYLAAGWLFVGLAMAGVPLPLLPTTPFLLLAASCFARSSPRLHLWLTSSKRFGPLLRQWQADRSVPAYAKRRAAVLIVVTFSISIAVVDSTGLRCMLIGMCAALLFMMSRLTTTKEEHREPMPASARDAAKRDRDLLDSVHVQIGLACSRTMAEATERRALAKSAPPLPLPAEAFEPGLASPPAQTIDIQGAPI